MEIFNNSPAVITLLALNVVLTLICFGSKTLLTKMLFIPFDVYHNKSWYRLFTSCFIHSDLGHVLFNMIALFSFGIMLEQTVGSAYFVLIYAVCMITSHIPALIKHKHNPYYRSLGASGAVSGVIYSCILFDPLNIIYMQFFIPLPAALFGVLYLLYCWYAARHAKDGIAHDAHFAGAISGCIITMCLFYDIIFEIWANIIN